MLGVDTPNIKVPVSYLDQDDEYPIDRYGQYRYVVVLYCKIDSSSDS
jgi:hypothetical protein